MAVDDSYTKVLLHLNGADGSTDFIDESGKTWVNGATATVAQIDTAQYMFGGSSLMITGGTCDCMIYTAADVDFQLGSDDWTVEMWVRGNGSMPGGSPCLWGQGTAISTDTSILITPTSDLVPRIRVEIPGTTDQVVVTASASDAITTTWAHIACVRYGDNLYIYKDGLQVATGAISGPVEVSTQSVSVGNFAASATNASFAFPGWIDEVRFSKGIARYTAEFTPPGAEFMPSSGESIYFADGFSVY